MRAINPIYEHPSAVAEQNATTPLCTLTLHIPRFHNPDEHGRRRKCEFSKLKITLRELRQLFTGYSVAKVRGWTREDGVRDYHYRFDMDFIATVYQLKKIRAWKVVLEDRFEQRSIYMKLSDRTVWICSSQFLRAEICRFQTYKNQPPTKTPTALWR